MKLVHLAILVLAGFGLFYVAHMVIHHPNQALNPMKGR